MSSIFKHYRALFNLAFPDINGITNPIIRRDFDEHLGFDLYHPPPNVFSRVALHRKICYEQHRIC